MSSNTKIYSNLRIYDHNTNLPIKKTIYVEDGLISKISDEVLFQDQYVIDCNNSFLIPGFVDGHGHVAHMGKTQFEVDLSECNSEEDAIQKIYEFYDNNKSLKIIFGSGWNQEDWDAKTLPNNEKLSLKFPNIPVIMARVDAHALWVNKKTLEEAGINTDTPSPDGGDILIEDGKLTGILVDKAQRLVNKIIPSETLEDVKKWILKAQEICLSNGITEVHDAGISLIQYNAYLSLLKENKLKMRIYAMANQELFEKGISKQQKDLFELRSIKLVSDGALGSRGAALIEKYSDYDTKGILILDKSKLKNLFVKAFNEDFQVCIHAIGDKANKEVLEALETKEVIDVIPDDHRTRIEHAQIIKEDDIKKFFNNKVIASIQPVHCISDMYMAEVRLGSRVNDSYLWRSLLENKIKLMGGSDFPVEDCSPIIGIHAAVNRQKLNFLPTNGWQLKEKVNIKEAVDMFTKDAAYGSFKENMKGEIKKGFVADFTLLDQNIFEIDSTEILNTKILGTVVKGDLMYKNF
tara:strand:- start:2179 stop:3741 length:1563 start_codon:yes stop_codon:yes gene_type:complete